jgi:hypothetical protein
MMRMSGFPPTARCGTIATDSCVSSSNAAGHLMIEASAVRSDTKSIGHTSFPMRPLALPWTQVLREAFASRSPIDRAGAILTELAPVHRASDYRDHSQQLPPAADSPAASR